ncbi:MAG: hypothetical protein C0506_01315 [Anaerolinea sp.]|nr:hypothetical protein [Anaerolinea sp.]
MDAADFSEDAPGTLISLPEGAPAFVPNRLPPPLHLSPALLPDVEAARGAVSELVGQARLVANLELVARALARREAVLSSRLEGTNTEIVEVLLQQADTAPVEEDTDLHEVLNYTETISLARAWMDEGRRLGPPLIKDLHSRLLSGVRGRDKRPGEYRLKNVYIGDRARGFKGARFVPPPYEHVPLLMDDLVAFTAGSPAYGPMIDSALAHYQFETIHPFEDGNGRLGRLLVPLQLVERGVLDRPLIYLGPFLDAHEAEYRDGLLQVSRSGSWEAWLRFFLEALRATATDALQRVQSIMELQLRYRELLRLRASSKFAFPALDLVFDSVFVSAGQLATTFSTTPTTARAIIDSFVDLGILKPYGRVAHRHRWVCHELLERVYQ